jgi:hypothetical protein
MLARGIKLDAHPSTANAGINGDNSRILFGVILQPRSCRGQSQTPLYCANPRSVPEHPSAEGRPGPARTSTARPSRKASYIDLIGRLTFIPFGVPLAANRDIRFADFAVFVHGARVFASKRAWIASTPLTVPMAVRICDAQR